MRDGRVGDMPWDWRGKSPTCTSTPILLNSFHVFELSAKLAFAKAAFGTLRLHGILGGSFN